MGLLFIIVSVCVVSGLSMLLLPSSVALHVSGVAIMIMTMVSFRFFILSRRLTDFAVRIGCGRHSRQHLILKALEEKFSAQEKALGEVVNTLAGLGENVTEATQIAIAGPIGDALRALQSKLTKLKAEEQRQLWASRGMAALSDLKRNNGSLDEYAYHAISTLANYTGSSQAAFYLLDSESTRLKLLAGYAHNIGKASEVDVFVDGEDGVLGQCIKERNIIHMAEVPPEYIKINSGLGEASPSAVIVIPMQYRDQVYGVIEMASFRRFESFQIEFCRKFAEGIAAELSGLQIQEKTSKLLEQAQIQADQLMSQEEELRQNMEEMSATQEEMARQQLVLKEKISEIDGERAKHQAILETCVDAVISFGADGKMQFANKAARDMFGYDHSEMMDQSVFGLFDFQVVRSAGGGLQLTTKTGNAITARTEVDAIDSGGNTISLLLTVAQVNLKGESLFTLFAQKISVDLF